MKPGDVAYVTDTYFSVLDGDLFFADRAAWLAVSEWVKRHGLTPEQVAACGPIHRDIERCRVVYAGRTDEYPGHAWTTCVQQGETPPMPWPTELDKYRVPS